MSNYSYRADIDGLRTVAVLPVVAFHLGISYMPGGFAGVDVFFVISGFLITRIIFGELESGTFSLTAFYVRRVRRLIPALFVVMLATLIAAYLWFLPEDMANTGKSTIAAALFASNILFFLDAGYFDAASYTKPLLHTWSLAIEEQFYLAMPLLLMVLTRFGAPVRIVIFAITAASLFLSIWTTSQYPTAAYYLLPWRSWELGIGALLALGVVPAIRHPGLRELATTLGLASILGAMLFIDRSTPFPGSAALLPTVGAALILHAGQSGTTVVSRILSARLPVFIGKLSYSLYLWHWPVIVFFTYQTLRMPDPPQAAGLFALSLALAWASYMFVEQPLRHAKPDWRVGQVFLTAGVSVGLVIGVAGAFYISRGLPSRLPTDASRIAAFNADFHPDRYRCWGKKSKEGTWAQPCIFGADPSPTVALIGDSHANALVPALEQTAESLGFSFALLGNDGCPALAGVEVYWSGEDHSCAAAMAASFKWLDNNPQVETIIFMIRPALYVKGWLPYGFKEFGRGELLIGDGAGPLANEAERADFFFGRLSQTLGRWRADGRQVVLVYPFPEAGNNVPASLVRRMVKGNAPETYALDRSLFDARNKDIVGVYDELVRKYDLTAIRVDKSFCGNDSCSLYVENTPVYYDSNHLSATYARKISPLFEDALAPLISTAEN